MTTLEEAVFGTKVAKVLPHLEEVFKRLQCYQYPFVAEDEFDKVCRRRSGDMIPNSSGSWRARSYRQLPDSAA